MIALVDRVMARLGLTAPKPYLGSKEELIEALWSARQFIIDNVHSGKEFDAVLAIDRAMQCTTNMDAASIPLRHKVLY